MINLQVKNVNFKKGTAELNVQNRRKIQTEGIHSSLAHINMSE